MDRRAVTSRLVGGPTGPFPAAMEAGHHVFVSLQVALDAHGRLEEGTAAAQAARALENVRLHLQVAGLRLDDVVKLTAYVTDIAAAADVDAALAGAFREPLPARTAVAVAALPHGAAVGIEAVAARY